MAKWQAKFLVCQAKIAMNCQMNETVAGQINPLSPNSAQDQFSPNDIHRLS